MMRKTKQCGLYINTQNENLVYLRDGDKVEVIGLGGHWMLSAHDKDIEFFKEALEADWGNFVTIEEWREAA